MHDGMAGSPNWRKEKENCIYVNRKLVHTYTTHVRNSYTIPFIRNAQRTGEKKINRKCEQSFCHLN